jgi:predicted ribosomally synthesized peptide with nif11-like leader
MSQSETKRFFDAVASDAGLKSGAGSAGGGLAGVAAFAQSNGYDVSEGDLQGLASSGGEMSDSDLDKVAGGGIGVSVGCVVCISAST